MAALMEQGGGSSAYQHDTLVLENQARQGLRLGLRKPLRLPLKV
jgi:hypothetical protein